jgi:sodium transport system permease protein
MFDLVPRDDQGTAALIEALVRRLDPVSLVLLLGLLPAVAEELLFRGWCLRGFRSQMSGLAAVVLSSVLFGAFHLEPERIAFTTALGLGLGFLALRSGSVGPGLLAHALHNGITVAFARSTLDGDPASLAARTLGGGDAMLGGVGLALVAAGIALAALARRRDSLPGTERAG